MRLICLIFGIFSAAAYAEGDISVQFINQTLYFDNGVTQSFSSDGKTTYTGDRPSFGEWKISDGQYCSSWTPKPNWTCYDVFIGAEAITFTDSKGNETVGYFQSQNDADTQ